MANSPLVCYTKLSPHHTKMSGRKIDTITIHHMAGNLTVETCGHVFQTRQASSNYGIGSDGRIALYVDESNRSWASSSFANDKRAITIEVANCGGTPDWPVSDKAYAALIELLVDICKRRGIQKLVWIDSKADRVGHKNGCNMTVHQDFIATACPGPYLLKKMPQIAADVNARLSADQKKFEPYTVRVDVKNLGIFSRPGRQHKQTAIIPQGVYTIVEEQDGWGKLKSGAGWVELQFVAKRS